MASSENVLEWAQKDKRRMLHAVYRVGDLDRTIKYNSVPCKRIFFQMFCILWFVYPLFLHG